MAGDRQHAAALVADRRQDAAGAVSHGQPLVAGHALRVRARPAPPHPGGIPNVGDWVMREAYSHEVSSAGFWPGDARFPEAAFYAYAYPEPAGFREAPVQPAAARFEASLGEFVLPYRAVR